MGSAISSVLSSDAFVQAATSFFLENAKYILKLEDNLDALQSVAERLRARKVDLQNKIEIAERQGLQQLEEVRVLLSEVEAMESKVCLLLGSRDAESDRLCMYGYCSYNFISTYHYGKDVSEKLEEGQGILSSKPPDVVATKGLPPAMEKMPTQRAIGLEKMLEATWNHLMKDEVGILGLYGMGGVGKTTLLEQINNEFLKEGNEFDVVISVVVSQNLQIGKIQNEIGKSLGLCTMEWEGKNQKHKAFAIDKVLTRKRFVVLLDDIWRKVELKDIGIPLPSPENRSKVVFTTRLRQVCGRMGPDDMEVRCLDEENAWKLFQQKVTPNTLASHPMILDLAKEVCGKCQGLPLALNVIGETMARKMTVRDWKRAIGLLKSNAAGYPEVKDEILKLLKFSYDDLEDEIVQQCFQYCALFPEDDEMEKYRLVDYWICEGIINEGGDREEAMNKGYDVIGILVNACMLINNESGERVSMHDVVRQMALWIASYFGEEQENFVVRAGAGLHQMPEVRDWNAVRRMSLHNNEIQNILITPDCPNLTTLFLQQNKLENISGDFFLSMPKLVVLDLTWNEHLNKLPEEVSKLLGLRYLGLAGTRLENLPVGLRKLIQLRYLDLSNMKTHPSINVISSLVNLETLHLYNSTFLSKELIDDIKLLKKLNVLSVSINDLHVLEHLLSISSLARCIDSLYLEGIDARNVSFATATASLRLIEIYGCFILYIMEEIYLCRSPSAMSFQNLSYVTMSNVDGLCDLTWLLFAPSLRFLNVSWLRNLQEIISRRKVDAGIMNEGSNTLLFSKLWMLSLTCLGELNSIYWEPLVFPDLTTIIIAKCPKLKKLPFNKESFKGNHIRLFVENKEWFEEIEWEDEATKDKLFHSQ